MRKASSEIFRALALLVLFVAGAILGMLLAGQGFGPWKDARFSLAAYSASAGVATARYCVLVGCSVFLICAFCIFNLLRHDLGHKRKRK
jgi:hypothetical protein